MSGTNEELIRIREKWEHDGYHPWKDDAFKALKIAERMEAERDTALAVLAKMDTLTLDGDKLVMVSLSKNEPKVDAVLVKDVRAILRGASA